MKAFPNFHAPKPSLLHIAALCTFAISHPLYDLLTRHDHATFFLAHQSKAIDIYILVFLLSVLLPVAAFLLLRVVTLLSARLARGLYALLIFLLLALLSLPVAQRFLDGSEAVTIGVVTLASLFATLLFFTTTWAKSFVSFLSVAVVLSPLIFLTAASTRSYLASPDAQDYTLLNNSAPLPHIVMIIFDELPLASLLNEARLIDGVRYPNFARFAALSHWYRNASGTHYSTSGGALPSILTGWYPNNYYKHMPKEHMSAPGVTDRRKMPRSIFSLLETTHRIFAVESSTKLAPENESTAKNLPPIKERIVSLSCDALVLYGHMVTPATFKMELPQIHGRWAGFCTPTEKETPAEGTWPYRGKKPENVRRFIETVHNAHQPTFYFFHSLLPHFPFIYNDKGQVHSNKFKLMTMEFRYATGTNAWPNETIANLAYQAHLIQLRFTDRLFGHVLDRLRQVGLLEESLIIVTADHGTSFFWDSAGLSSDRLKSIQASEAMYVPLFIKLPYQEQGTVSDRQVEAVDVLPTISDILDLEIPWEPDGSSVFAAERPTRDRIAMLPLEMKFGEEIDPEHASLKRKVEIFGSGDIEGLYSLGPHQEMVGKSVSTYTATTSKETVQFVEAGRNARFEADGPRVRAYVEGAISNELGRLDPNDLDIAVAINGSIVNVTSATDVTVSSLMSTKKAEKDGRIHFLVRIPSGRWHETENVITVHGIVEDDRGEPASLINFAQEP